MSKLIREQRLDKNGVLTTKLVRAEAKGKSSRKSLPPPFVAEISTKVTVSKTQQSYLDSLEMDRIHRVSSDDWRSNADADLREVCLASKPPKKLKCSDAEIFDVLEVVSEENVLPLLSAGVRSSKQAKKLLKANGLDRLLIDNAEQVKNLKYWGMRPNNAVMTPRPKVRKDMYGSSEGYGSLSLSPTTFSLSGNVSLSQTA